jgi:iron(III) transport system permease protein
VRIHKSKIADNLVQIAKLGYSIPGAVVAVGVLSFFSYIDKSFDILLSGTVIAVIFGYIVRFIAISINNYESGFSKIPQSYDDACKTMQVGSFYTFFKVIFPLLKGSIMTSFIVIFIETLKELPLTMILRPFNFDTLPVLSHELVTQAQVIESAVPAMFIVLFGMVSVLVLVKKMVKD